MTQAQDPTATGGLPTIPMEDFRLHGPIEEQPLTRIQKVSGPHLHRSWVNIPHVTHFEEADITELDRFRRRLREEGKDSLRASLLVFVVRAAVAALQKLADLDLMEPEFIDERILKLEKLKYKP